MTRAGMKIRRALRLVGWNMLFLVAGLVLIGGVGEMYFRLRAPFGETFRLYAWSPNVGGIFAPKAEVRHTNHLDFWTESRTNGLGFAGRELQRAALLHQRARDGAADVRGGADHQRRFDPAVHGAALPSSAGSTTSKRPSQIRPSPVNWPVRIAAMA